MNHGKNIWEFNPGFRNSGARSELLRLRSAYFKGIGKRTSLARNLVSTCDRLRDVRNRATPYRAGGVGHRSSTATERTIPAAKLVVADFAKGRAVLNRRRDAGIRVSIDDFGSGYSTLTYLRELPIDEVKLDRHLITPIPYDQRAATIARSVIELAEEFGIASVAEGIENDETVQWLRRFGCDVVQGNYFCGPLPAGEIPQVPSVPTQKV